MHEKHSQRKQLPIKLISIGIGLVVLLIVCIFVFLKIKSGKSSPINIGTISPRAEEFLASQNQDGDSLFTQFDLSATPSATTIPNLNGKITTDCFSLQLPWKFSQPQTEVTPDRCTFKARSQSPLAHLVIALYESSTFETDSGISLRRQQPELYRATTLDTVPYPAVIFQTDHHLILFAQVNNKMLTIALNDLATEINISNTTWTDILQSLQVTTSSPVDPNLLP